MCFKLGNTIALIARYYSDNWSTPLVKLVRFVACDTCRSAFANVSKIFINSNQYKSLMTVLNINTHSNCILFQGLSVSSLTTVEYFFKNDHPSTSQFEMNFPFHFHFCASIAFISRIKHTFVNDNKLSNKHTHAHTYTHIRFVQVSRAKTKQIWLNERIIKCCRMNEFAPPCCRITTINIVDPRCYP